MRGEVATRLRETLEDDIVSGRLRPGERLDESDLAGRFGVSRTPIREALIQLSGSGMIELRPRRGAQVTLLGPRELLEYFELMGELEASCAGFAARRMNQTDRDRIALAHEACRTACRERDSDAYYRANAEFHEAIYAGAGNRALLIEARALQRRLQPYRRLQLRVQDRLLRSFAEHEGIFDALMAGDGALAGDRLRAHVVVQGERFMALLAELQRETGSLGRTANG